jgi:hypothetical protein
VPYSVHARFSMTARAVRRVVAAAVAAAVVAAPLLARASRGRCRVCAGPRLPPKPTTSDPCGPHGTRRETSLTLWSLLASAGGWRRQRTATTAAPAQARRGTPRPGRSLRRSRQLVSLLRRRLRSCIAESRSSCLLLRRTHSWSVRSSADAPQCSGSSSRQRGRHAMRRMRARTVTSRGKWARQPPCTPSSKSVSTNRQPSQRRTSHRRRRLRLARARATAPPPPPARVVRRPPQQRHLQAPLLAPRVGWDRVPP